MLLDESRQVKRKNGFTFLVKPFSEFYHQRGSPTFPTNNGNETLKFDCVGAAKTSSVVFPRSSKSAIGAFGICVEAFSVQSKSLVLKLFCTVMFVLAVRIPCTVATPGFPNKLFKMVIPPGTVLLL